MFVMSQLPLFDDNQRIVNVASVPHRSPFRYPGGKTWFVPRVRRWLSERNPRPAELVEPFAGGGIVGLTAAFEGLAERVTMVEMDEWLAAVWRTIVEEPGGAERLSERIAEFEMSLSAVREVLDSSPETTDEIAFFTILKNRVNRGGILAPGASLVKAGENGRGISSRWYPQTLKKRILDIAGIRARITFVHGDGLEVMENFADRSDFVFFVDPPYTLAAKRLYNHWALDHASLFETASRLSGDFLMTYDNDEQIRSLAAEYDFDTREISMKNTHHAKMTELLIGRDLSWAD